jgi:hypothetical protein
MEPILIETELDARDWDALQLYLQRQCVEQGQSRRQRLVEVLIVVLTVAVAMYALRSLSYAFQPLALLSGVLIGATAIMLVVRQRVRHAPRPGSPIPRARACSSTKSACTRRVRANQAPLHGRK